MSDPIKIAIDLSGQVEASYPPFEFMWALEAGEGLAIIDNIPFFARGLNFGDVVAIRGQKTEKAESIVTRVVERSGHSTFHVILTPGNDNLPRLQAAITLILDALETYGCGYERSGEWLYAIDVPPNPRVKASLVGMLDQGSSEGKWEYEESGSEQFVEVF